MKILLCKTNYLPSILEVDGSNISFIKDLLDWFRIIPIESFLLYSSDNIKGKKFNRKYKNISIYGDFFISKSNDGKLISLSEKDIFCLTQDLLINVNQNNLIH